jgi:hypothetical protein
MNRGFFRLLLDGRATDQPGNTETVEPATAPATWGAIAADPSRVAMLAFAFFLLAPLPWVAVYFLPPLNHDAAALLHFAQRWLGGEQLYVDLIDVNPPLIFVLNLVPAALARLMSFSAPIALILCVLAWIAVGFAFSWRLLREAAGSIGSIHRYVLPPLFLFLMIAYPGPEFAQREHLMVVAALPYLLLALARIERRELPRGVAIGVALFAAIAFALKPHFLLIPLLVEACVVGSCGLRRELRDPVPWTLGLFFVAYAAFVLLVTPQYLGFVVPLAMSEYRNLGGLGAWGVLFNSQLTASAALLLPLGVASLFVRRSLPRLAAVAAFAAVVIAMVQGKGWPYHALPGESFVLLLAAALLCEAFDAQAPRLQQRRSLAPTLLLVALMLGSYYISALTRDTFWRQARFHDSQAGQLLERFGKLAAQGPMLVLSPGIYPHFPVVNYAGTKMAMRFMTMWPIQGAYQKCLPDGRMFRNPAEMAPAESFAYHAIAEDLNRYRPKLVIVDKQPGILMCGGKDFDYLAYFRRNPLFEANWQRYRLLAEYDRYWVYVRR